MKVELPEFKRCCCCIPLRYGLLGWGYIKLIFSLLLLIILTNQLVNCILLLLMGFRGVIIGVVVSVIFILIVLLDISLSIVFLIGGHQKTAKLLRVCYIYNIVILCITTLFAVVSSALELYIKHAYFGSVIPHGYVYFGFMVQVKVVAVLLNFAIQAYVILLIRSEIKKLTSNCNFRFENVALEAECTMENGLHGHENETNGNENGTNELKNGANKIDSEVNDRFDETDNLTEATGCESFNYVNFRLN